MYVLRHRVVALVLQVLQESLGYDVGEDGGDAFA